MFSLFELVLRKDKLVKLAKTLESVGTKIILIECVTEKAVKIIKQNIKIPIIGIGASSICDGQVLVTDDILNLDNKNKVPKFIKKYADLNRVAKNAINKFVREVKQKKFPSKKNIYF